MSVSASALLEAHWARNNSARATAAECAAWSRLPEASKSVTERNSIKATVLATQLVAQDASLLSLKTDAAWVQLVKHLFQLYDDAFLKGGLREFLETHSMRIAVRPLYGINNSNVVDENATHFTLLVHVDALRSASAGVRVDGIVCQDALEAIQVSFEAAVIRMLQTFVCQGKGADAVSFAGVFGRIIPSASSASAGAAARLVCSGCKRRRYTSREEQAQDWPRHKKECGVSAPASGSTLDVAQLWDVKGARRLFGPFLEDGVWKVGKGEITLSTSAAEILRAPMPSVEAVRSRHLSPAFQDLHQESGIAYPKQMLCVFTRIFESKEVMNTTAQELMTRKLALPGNVPLSRSAYWRWFTSGKCDAYVFAQVLALNALHRTLGTRLTYQNETITEWGAMQVFYTKPFVPVCRTFGWARDRTTGRMVPTTDIDALTDACAHRVLYLKSANQTVYVDFTAAQYEAHADDVDLNQADTIPVLVMHGMEEMKRHGFVPHPDVQPVDNGPKGVARLDNALSTCASHYREGTYAVAYTLLQHLAPLCTGYAQAPASTRRALTTALPEIHVPVWEMLQAAGTRLP